LIIIFRSTGPVISTLLSFRLFGIGLTDHSEFLISSVLGSNDGKLPSSMIFWYSTLSSRSLSILSLNLRCTFSKKCSAFSENISEPELEISFEKFKMISPCLKN